MFQQNRNNLAGMFGRSETCSFEFRRLSGFGRMSFWPVKNLPKVIDWDTPLHRWQCLLFPPKKAKRTNKWTNEKNGRYEWGQLNHFSQVSLADQNLVRPNSDNLRNLDKQVLTCQTNLPNGLILLEHLGTYLVVYARATRGWPLKCVTPFSCIPTNEQTNKWTRTNEQKWKNGQMDSYVWGQTVYLSVCPFLQKSCTMAWEAKQLPTKTLYMRRNSVPNKYGQMDERTNGRCEWGQVNAVNGLAL